MATPPEPEFLTIKQACELLQCSEMTLMKLRRAGKLKDIYPHGRPETMGPGKYLVRIARADLMKLMEQI